MITRDTALCSTAVCGLLLSGCHLIKPVSPMIAVTDTTLSAPRAMVEDACLDSYEDRHQTRWTPEHTWFETATFLKNHDDHRLYAVHCYFRDFNGPLLEDGSFVIALQSHRPHISRLRDYLIESFRQVSQ